MLTTKPEFSPHNPHGRRREPNYASYPCPSHHGLNGPIFIYTQINVKVNIKFYILFTSVYKVRKRLGRGRHDTVLRNVRW